ncbi:MAG: hypothetical protein ACYTGL_12530 [Planctomycetota bacterium]|jgi:hypothetical protein
MNGSESHELAPIAELRLRQWARRNYVPADLRRDEEWHPVVLDEMQRCDAEFSDSESTETLPQFDIVTSSGIVPLEPSRHESVRIDAAHDNVATPRFKDQQTQRSNTNPVIPFYA